MGTIIDQLEVARGGWRNRHSALHLAVAAARNCLDAAHRDADDLDLLVNAGIYRDRNLGEPALAALIQEDIGANPEDPHEQAHGTFSFDISNGACGILTGLQIVDGFLRSGSVTHALITASDADPGRGLSRDFPFSPVGAALLCNWADGDLGLGRVSWVSRPDGGATFRATVGSGDARNVLRFEESPDLDDRFAEAAAEAVRTCLHDAALATTDLDAVVAAPARPGYRAALAGRLGVRPEQIVLAEDANAHTASLAAGLKQVLTEMPGAERILIVAAAAGITAGAALYRRPPPR